MPRKPTPPGRRTRPTPAPAFVPPSQASRPEPSPPATLWLFEDQLAHHLAALRDYPAAHVLLVESKTHYRSLPYHKHRIAFLVSSMRHFAAELRAAGRNVHHYPLASPPSSPSSRGEGQPYRDSLSALEHHCTTHRPAELLVVEPSEHHTMQWVESLAPRLAAWGVKLRFLPNTLFLTDRDEFAAWATGLKSPVMEFFYRRQRAKFGVLMEGDQPAGGAWNFDKLNRKPPARGLVVPPMPRVEPDAITRQVLADVDHNFPAHPGRTENFALPVTRDEALSYFREFLAERLPLFGDFEDAMVTGEPFLFHSFISPQINAGLLEPLECIRAAEAEYRAGRAPLNAVEGFVRQILGWREYVYGIYHAFMPEYRTRNARKSARPLPAFYWSADTDMNCLRQTLTGLLDHAYTHHIQRLMILCNFATLAGLSPQAVNDWFLAMYADSHDWVVTPNVIGMGMNADNGTMATKPYVSSGAYINRMSDYCKGCKYNIATRNEGDSCPFNYLYWTFLQHYRQAYASNPRMTMILKNLDRIDAGEMKTMMRLRKTFLEGLPGYVER